MFKYLLVQGFRVKEGLSCIFFQATTARKNLQPSPSLTQKPCTIVLLKSLYPFKCVAPSTLVTTLQKCHLPTPPFTNALMLGQEWRCLPLQRRGLPQSRWIRESRFRPILGRSRIFRPALVSARFPADRTCPQGWFTPPSQVWLPRHRRLLHAHVGLNLPPPIWWGSAHNDQQVLLSMCFFLIMTFLRSYKHKCLIQKNPHTYQDGKRRDHSDKHRQHGAVYQGGQTTRHPSTHRPRHEMLLVFHWRSWHNPPGMRLIPAQRFWTPLYFYTCTSR